MSSNAEQAPWFMGMIGGCTNCFSIDTETFERGAVKGVLHPSFLFALLARLLSLTLPLAHSIRSPCYAEVRFNELRMARQAQIVSEAQYYHDQATESDRDDDSVAPSSTTRPASLAADGAATPRFLPLSRANVSTRKCVFHAFSMCFPWKDSPFSMGFSHL